MISQEEFDLAVRSGGCVWGGGAKGQGKALCRAAVIPGRCWCERHAFMVDVDTKATRREANAFTEKAAAAIRCPDRRSQYFREHADSLRRSA